MASPTLEAIFSLPSTSLFAFPPNPNPQYLPPAAPGSGRTAAPVLIPDHIYRAVLDPRVPLTIATVYAVTVKSLNVYNKSTGKKPWAISQTRAFHLFVVLHNVFLAVYSAWTFWGMLGALRRGIVSPSAPAGLAGTVDSFCRLSGPPGLGNAAYYSEETDGWQSHAAGVSITGGEPSRTTPGRVWNEGLAFYGWIFYLSKFYEVLDTFIILAKGKLSSTLQTYHHAGAMMCMWAGMRYMSAPIWMFAFVNSGIHALMYTYYTLTAFSIRVPIVVKRSLTTMQITQFLVGASYAMLHSFVSYTIPIAAAANMTTSTEEAGSAAATTSIQTVATAAAELLDSLRNMIAGAIVGNAADAASPASAGAAATPQTRLVPCITTTGETFAIWLNVLYLAPLTYLFVKFFITSYIKRSSAEAARFKKGTAARRESNVTLAEKAGWDAARSMEREVYGEPKDAPNNRKARAAAASASASAAVRANANANGNGSANGSASPKSGKSGSRANGRKR